MELRAEVGIDGSAHAAWALLGERFGQISDWAAPIETSSLEGQPSVGAIRTCQFVGFGPFRSGTIKERLVEFDLPTRSIAYRPPRVTDPRVDADDGRVWPHVGCSDHQQADTCADVEERVHVSQFERRCHQGTR